MKEIFVKLIRPNLIASKKKFFPQIVDQVPQIIQDLEKYEDDKTREVLSDFCGLIKILLVRFPAKPPFEVKHNNIKLAVSVSESINGR